jgi:hypothetical protein
MKSAPVLPGNRSQSAFSALLVLLTVGSIVFASGCASNSQSSQPATTQVVLLYGGTANDQLSQFALELQSLTLTDKKGNTVSLLSSAQGTEYIHLNGGVEPLATATIPHGTYTSATAVVGWAQLTCIQLTQTSLATSTYAYGQTPANFVTVNLPSPIVVSGDSMALSLNLLVEQSAALSPCFASDTINPFSITPTFNLTAYDLAAQPTNAANGEIFGFNGQVATLGTTGDSFTSSLPNLENTRTVAINAGASTIFQGIPNFAALATGSFINLDAAVQPDGSLLASRISVPDPNAVFINVGQVLSVDAIAPDLALFGRQEQGGPFQGINLIGSLYFTFPNANFLISSQFSNLQQLPFTPVFNASTMVAGQNVFLTSPSSAFSSNPYPGITTLTLVPQTIDGTISGVSTTGNFTVYSVDLPSYDLFPMLAVQPGQTTLLNNPSEVEVYVDSNTSTLNSQPLASGGIFRFYGLVFNDSGTLRMDCAQINDGVSVSPLPAPPPTSSVKASRVQILHDVRLPSGLRRIDRLITPVQ